MSVLRRFATKVSSFVVVWSSPGCKDWAKGLERELEHIRGDWAAFAWSMSSLRVVLDRRQSPVAERDLVTRLEWMWPCFLAIQVLGATLGAVRAAGWHARLGYALSAAGYMCWATLSVNEWLWKQNEPPVSDIRASRLFSRATLERRLKHYSSMRRWVPLIIPLALCSGFVLTYGGADGVGAIGVALDIAGGTVAIWLLCLDTPAKIQARLARVDERIAQSDS